MERIWKAVKQIIVLKGRSHLEVFDAQRATRKSQELPRFAIKS